MRFFDFGNKGAARFLELCENAHDLHSFTSVKFYFTILFRILHPVTADSHRCSRRLLRSIEKWFCCFSSELDLFLDEVWIYF